MHLLSLLICVAAFAALAMATDRAQCDVLGRERPRRSPARCAPPAGHCCWQASRSS